MTSQPRLAGESASLPASLRGTAFVDLHCHSTASDGTLTPAEVVRLAKAEGLTALALTDHDTVAGLAAAAAEARVVGIGFLPAIEISAECPRPGTLHILGYGIDPASPVLGRLMAGLVSSRAERNPRIIARLNQQGIDVSMDDWRGESGGGVMGRPQLAVILVRRGHARDIRDAFNRYIGETAPAYVDKEKLGANQAISAIRSAGGLPVLAHPTQLRKSSPAEIEGEIRHLADLGLAGIEVMHSDHDDDMVGFLIRLADDLGLLKTGGSDFHGANKPGIKLGWANGRRIPKSFHDDLVKSLRLVHRAGA